MIMMKIYDDDDDHDEDDDDDDDDDDFGCIFWLNMIFLNLKY